MTTLLRPRHEFPTPLFRLTIGALAGVLGGLPGWILIPRWTGNTDVYLAVLAVVAAAIALLVALRSSDGWRLATAAAYGVVAMLAAFGIEILVAIMTATYE